MLLLAIMLAHGENKASQVFAVSDRHGRRRRTAVVVKRQRLGSCWLRYHCLPCSSTSACRHLGRRGRRAPSACLFACTCDWQMVFAEVALGAIILTLNVILLGGEIVFFQSVCLLGYCLFPLVIAAIICAFISIKVCEGGGGGRDWV